SSSRRHTRFSRDWSSDVCSSDLNSSHLHDLGKWMFAISMLWSYLWFCQYMLIWYSNIPEEVTYFEQRYEHYMYSMWAIFFVNFRSEERRVGKECRSRFWKSCT